MNEKVISSNVLPERLLKAREVATILNISQAMTYRLMQKGIIRTIRIASSRRVRLKDLQNYIEENQNPA